MTLPRLNLLVLRSMNPEETVCFYTKLGLQFQAEQHGRGPMHWAADVEGIVFEVYPAKDQADVNCSTRLGFQVIDVAMVVNALREAVQGNHSDVQQSPWGIRAVVCDPDGRRVELIQQTTQ